MKVSNVKVAEAIAATITDIEDCIEAYAAVKELADEVDEVLVYIKHDAARYLDKAGVIGVNTMAGKASWVVKEATQTIDSAALLAAAAEDAALAAAIAPFLSERAGSKYILITPAKEKPAKEKPASKKAKK